VRSRGTTLVPGLPGTSVSCPPKGEAGRSVTGRYPGALNSLSAFRLQLRKDFRLAFLPRLAPSRVRCHGLQAYSFPSSLLLA